VDGYYDYNKNDDANTLLPKLNALIATNGDKTLFTEIRAINMSMRASAALRLIDKNGNEVVTDHNIDFLNKVFSLYDNAKIEKCSMLFRKFDNTNKLERFLSLYQFLTELLYEADINGIEIRKNSSIMRTATQKGVADYIKAKHNP